MIRAVGVGDDKFGRRRHLEFGDPHEPTNAQLTPDMFAATKETDTPELMREWLNTLLGGHYVLTHELGKGSTAVVFGGRDVQHDRLVAIKVLTEKWDSLTEQRFQREIQLQASLQHPNILPVYDSGSVGDLPYYVTPLMERGSLRHRLVRCEPLPVREAVGLAGDVARALDYVHRRGTVHRDVKPDNILLAGGHACLADFGVALPIVTSAADSLTQAGTGSPGTPLYMSPEQGTPGCLVDGRSDTYSLALVLFEMLVGSLPFQHVDRMTAYAWRYSTEAPNVRSLRPDVPEGVSRALARGLRRDANQRFATAQELAAAIQSAV